MASTMKVRFLLFTLCIAAACSSAPEPDEIIVGAALPLSGPMLTEAQHALNAIAIAMDEINASGQLGNAQLSLVTADDSLTASGAVSAVRSLIDEHGVRFLLGPATSSGTQAIIPLIREAGVIAIGPTSTAAGLSAQSEFLFRVALAVDKSVPAGIQISHERLGYTKVATIVNEADAFSTSSNEKVMEELAKYPDISIVSEQTYVGDPQAEAAEYDLSGQLTNTRDAAPDVIISSGLPEDQHAVLVQARALGITNIPFILTYATIDEIQRINADSPGAAENVIATTLWLSSSQNARSQAFVAAYEERFGETPGDIAAQAYASMNILGNALSRAADRSAASVRNALAATKGLETVLGSFSFDEHGDALYEPIVVWVNNNEFVELLPGSPE